MNCIDFCVIFKYCVKQLMIFGRTVVAASDLKNCTMVNCEYWSQKGEKKSLSLEAGVLL